jgi:CubicO group peptidase (beta-lactamase class C family)
VNDRCLRAFAVVLALMLCLQAAPLSQGSVSSNPATLGFSAERLARIGTVLKADIEKGRIPGAVLLVARHGKIAYFEAFGMRDKAKGAPMTKDAIFRIYSMTKPITSVAVMMLAEEGRLRLADPASKYLPQLARLKVGVEKADGQSDPALTMVSATREMTIQDLLRHTSGLTYGVFGRSAVKTLYTQAGVGSQDDTNADMIEKLSKLPLAYQPGTTWEYSHSTDVLGRVLEVVSGMPLDRFFQERIYGPLGMKDSGFVVPQAKHDRLAQPSTNPDTGEPERVLDVTKPRKFLSGGGGSVSTAEDYLRFCLMLLNGGQLDGARLLGRKTVELMTADHLGPIAGGARFLPGAGFGFGLGFAVRKDIGGATTPGSVGEFYWGGWAGTSFWIDPTEKLAVVFMIQAPSQQPYYPSLIRMLVEQALVDSVVVKN